MPGKGAPPSAERSRANDTARRQAEFEHVSADGELRGPDLPNADSWHPYTRAWWQTWRESAQAGQFTPTDWDFLLDTALLHHSMWTDGEVKNAAEIRIRLSKFGASPEDRMRLRLSVDTPEKPDSGESDSSRSDARSRRKGLRIAG